MDGESLFRMFVIHQLGCQLLAGRPRCEEAQKKMAGVLVNVGSAEEERKIAFFYLALTPSSELSTWTRRAIIEYASDPAHGDIVAQKGSARVVLTASLLDVTRRMGK